MNTNTLTLTLTMPIFGRYVQINAEDVDLLQYRWYVTAGGQVFRTQRTPGDATLRHGIYLAREIASRVYGPLVGRRVRTINGNRLDLRRANLEIIGGGEDRQGGKR